MAEIGGRSVSCSHVRRMLVTSAACVNHWEAGGGGGAQLKKPPYLPMEMRYLFHHPFFFFLMRGPHSFFYSDLLLGVFSPVELS